VVLFLLIYFFLPAKVLSIYCNINENQFKTLKNPYSVLATWAKSHKEYEKHIYWEKLIWFLCIVYSMVSTLWWEWEGGTSYNWHQKIEAPLGPLTSLITSKELCCELLTIYFIPRCNPVYIYSQEFCYVCRNPDLAPGGHCGPLVQFAPAQHEEQ
jgi:hypothetical protein